MTPAVPGRSARLNHNVVKDHTSPLWMFTVEVDHPVGEREHSPICRDIRISVYEKPR